jgi:hypothetical protein
LDLKEMKYRGTGGSCVTRYVIIRRLHLVKQYKADVCNRHGRENVYKSSVEHLIVRDYLEYLGIAKLDFREEVERLGTS